MGTLRPPYQQKHFFSVLGAFPVLKLKVAKIPIQNGPFLAPWDSLFSAPAIAYIFVDSEGTFERPGPDMDSENMVTVK